MATDVTFRFTDDSVRARLIIAFCRKYGYTGDTVGAGPFVADKIKQMVAKAFLAIEVEETATAAQAAVVIAQNAARDATVAAKRAGREATPTLLSSVEVLIREVPAPTGPTGSPGPTGATGPTGPTGPTGGG